MQNTKYNLNTMPVQQILKSFCLKSCKNVIISLLNLIVVSYFMPAIAQVNQVENSNSTHVYFNTNEPDGSSQGRPSGRRGTGSRGDCPSVEMPLEALIPNERSGLVIEENPTLWFYIPFKSNQVSAGEFSLQDEEKNDVMRTSFPVPTQPGIFSLQLKTAKPLEINKTYTWYFKLYCQNNTTSKSSIPSFVSGSLKRVAPDVKLEQQLKAATTPRAKIAAYAQNGIWYTALSELALLRIAEPQNTTFQQDWQNLLAYAGLKYLANKPIFGELKILQQNASNLPIR